MHLQIIIHNNNNRELNGKQKMTTGIYLSPYGTPFFSYRNLKQECLVLYNSCKFAALQNKTINGFYILQVLVLEEVALLPLIQYLKICRSEFTILIPNTFYSNIFNNWNNFCFSNWRLWFDTPSLCCHIPKMLEILIWFKMYFYLIIVTGECSI